MALEKDDIKMILDGVSELIDVKLKAELRAELKADLKAELKPIDNRLAKVELTIENEIRDNIQILAEGHKDLNRKMNTLQQKTDVLEQKVDVLGQKVDVLQQKTDVLEQKVDVLQRDMTVVKDGLFSTQGRVKRLENVK